MQSTSNIAKKHSEELQLCKEKVSSLEEQNCQLDLRGSKVKVYVTSGRLFPQVKAM